MNVLRNLVLILSVGAALSGCSPTPETQAADLPPPTAHTAQLADLGFSVANPVSSGNVKLIPIVSTSSNPVLDKDVVFLAEAKEKGYIEITEGEMSFNGVHVKNTSKHHILLMAGDLVTGGHQDRVIAHDIMIPPGEERDVEVFCVEQERSTGPTAVFTPSEQPVPHKVRREAMFAQDKQQSVWSSVDSYNSSAAAAPATRTVQGGLNSEQVQKHVSANEEELLSKLMAVKNVTGYVLIVDGKIDIAEVFGDPGLFERAAPQLLKSILAQQATKISTKPDSFAMAGVEEFLVSALTGKREAPSRSNDSEIAMFESPRAGERNRNLNLQTESGRDPTLRSPRGTETIAPSGDFEVRSNKDIRGYELYDSSKNKGAKGKLLHGTYAKP